MIMLVFFAADAHTGMVNDVVNAVQQADTEDRLQFEKPDQSPQQGTNFTIGCKEDGFRIKFQLNDPETTHRAEVVISGINDKVHPKWIDPSDSCLSDEFNYWIDTIFEIACRVSVILDAEYSVLLNTDNDPMSRVPDSRPIGSGIDIAPQIGVYSNSVLDRVGGVEGLNDGLPYYSAQLPGGQTLVIKSATPWTDTGWSPPTDAEYIESATFHDSSGKREEINSNLDWSLSDPFAALSPGEYGTDVCVYRDDIESTFSDQNVHLVRVRVDGAGNLRRISDDSFVRNIVTETFDDEHETIGAMLSEIPIDAQQDELMVSALLHEAIPSEFVRLDDPDGENVVTKVMNLDVEINTVDLLVSLGKALKQGSLSAEDVEMAEQAVDNLSTLEDVDGIDTWIQQNLF